MISERGRSAARLLVPSLLFLVALSIYSNVRLFYSTLLTPTIYHKDFLNDYVLGRAALLGIDPYAQIADLAQQFVGPAVGGVFPHPSPYPPPNILLFMPFGALPYAHAVLAWSLLQAASLFVVALLLVRHTEASRPILATSILGIAAFAWNAVAEDFIWGNVMLVLLVPLMLSWHYLRQQRDVLGGMFLGVVIALKLLAWPLLLFLFLKRRWRAGAASALTIVILNVIAVCVTGSGSAAYYYTKIPSIVTPLYRARVDNFSIYGIGWRWFEGTGSTAFDTLTVRPLFYSPQLAHIISAVLPLLALAAVLYFAFRTQNFDQSFALLLCGCVVFGPLAWRAYLVWLALPLTIVIQRFCKTQARGVYVLASVVAVLLFGYPTPLSIIAGALIHDEQTPAPFAVSLVTYIPLLAVAGLFWLLVKTDFRPKARA